MVNFKKAGIFISTAALSVGLLAPMASASTVGNERTDTLPIVVAQADTKVTKNDVIKRFRELFPNEFLNLKNKDFHLDVGYLHPNDPTERYELYFSKYVDNQYIHGSVMFVGETLELEQFYYEPAYSKDLLFPAKHSKEEAQKIADQLVKKLNKGENYELIPSEYNYFSSNLLTDPIIYSFNYAKQKSGVPISDQMLSVNVLGDGTVTSYYKIQSEKTALTYDDPATVQSEAVVTKRFKDALKAQLAYKIDTDYRTGKHSVKLVYQPNKEANVGVHAKTGQWMVPGGFSSTLPADVVQPIAASPLPAKQPNLTEAQAEEVAKKLLATDQEGVQLTIESVNETTTETGKPVYEIHYMYEYEDGADGSVLIIDQATGEILSFYEARGNLGMSEEREANKVLTQQQALQKAIAYVKDWVPSYAHEYALPATYVESYSSYTNSYYFAFPRIVNGLAVDGDQIMIDIDAETGELLGLFVQAYENIEWPEATDILTEAEATELMQAQLKPKLQYVNHLQAEDEQHYSLVYQPVFKDGLSSMIDAKTGQWLNIFGRPHVDTPAIEHATASDELNYLIQTGILEVDETFDPEAAVTKEEALKILLKSLTYMYYSPDDDEMVGHSFTDITPEDELYPYIVQALRMGMLDASSETFNADTALSNQELAKWMISTLQLDKAAQYSNIYKLNYRDAAKVDKELRGYVALAYAMELLEAENKQLKPQNDVTYAQLAQVTIRLAHKMNEFQIDNY